MAVVKNAGNEAGADWHRYEEGSAFWVSGHNVTLTSAGFASCVGMVICGDIPGYGAVAHFWNPAGLNEAKIILEAFKQWQLQQAGAYDEDDFEALVFGGTAINTMTGAKVTRTRLDAIAGYLQNDREIVTHTDYNGASAVALDLTVPGGLMDKVRLERPRSPMRGGGDRSKLTGSF